VILIAHRGNIHGRNTCNENKPFYLENALMLGYHVECDVWCKDGKLYLGHDKPQYKVGLGFFTRERVWTHCKNVEALEKLHKNPYVNCFFHTTDPYTLTSRGYIWIMPGHPLTESGILVLPELNDIRAGTEKIAGICSDKIVDWKANDQLDRKS
jgi:hypothetical protein